MESLRTHPRFREIGSWPYRYDERIRLYEVLPPSP
jgi:hypothetical protein